MGDGYALDLLTVVRHVATELDRVSPEALSVSELAASYTHPNPGDLSRVKRNEGLARDQDVVDWLIGQAIEAITYRGSTSRSARQVESNGRGVRLADGVSFDDLLYDSKRLARQRNDHAALRDPFNPMSGRFSDNVRTRPERKDSPELRDLRESMREFGWIKELPAISDERGVVLVGHRRLAVATELGIEPNMVKVICGDGDEGDARRFKLAVASNLGAKGFAPEERKDIAEYLCGERGWTIERIGQALNVGKSTVARDLAGFSHDGKTSRPKGGRPRGSTSRKTTPEQIATLLDQGKSESEIAQELSISASTANAAVREEKVRREERERAAAVPGVPAVPCTCPNCGHTHQRATS